jgi:hypothetical protein
MAGPFLGVKAFSEPEFQPEVHAETGNYRTDSHVDTDRNR